MAGTKDPKDARVPKKRTRGKSVPGYERKVPCFACVLRVCEDPGAFEGCWNQTSLRSKSCCACADRNQCCSLLGPDSVEAAQEMYAMFVHHRNRGTAPEGDQVSTRRVYRVSSRADCAIEWNQLKEAALTERSKSHSDATATPAPVPDGEALVPGVAESLAAIANTSARLLDEFVALRNEAVRRAEVQAQINSAILATLKENGTLSKAVLETLSELAIVV